MSDRIRMAESDLLPQQSGGRSPPEETTEPQPPPPPPHPEPEQPPSRREGPEAPPPAKEAEPPEDNSDLPPSFQERLNRSTREKWELRRQVEQAQAQVREIQQQFQQWQQATRGQTGQQGANDTTDAEQRAYQRFQQQAQEERFNEACNAVYQRGKQEFADFDDAVRALIDVGAGQRPDFLSAVAQLPDGHRVYRQLASDLDNAGRIMRLPPMQMAMELALLSGRSNGAAQPAPEPVRQHSRAPAPLRPIGGTSRAPQRLENVSMAEFIKMRDKEETERRR